MAHEGWHEAPETLTPRTRDMHRALASLQEELEAIDWYQQRIDATEDADLRRILEHNRDEEKEHAAMVLEWIRRHDLKTARTLSTYLFSFGDVTKRESETERKSGDARPEATGI